MKDKRIVAALMGDGRIGLIEEDIPPVRPGAVLVEVRNSLVSPGTEFGGWRGLLRLKENPKPNARPRPFGYANAGIVMKVGEGVEEFKEGDRVACMGGGYALHTNYAVVPHNLCVHLPDSVTFAQGAYGHLAATAINALRRGEPEFGEYVAVVGLGVLGQLCAMLHQLAGDFVIGWDLVPFRNETARKWGIDATALVGVDDEVELTREFTNGSGLDAAVFAFAGNGDAAIERVLQCMRRLPDGHTVGRIVVVGGVEFAHPTALTNADVRKASRTGPGYHDEEWEFGPDYPHGLVRWTTRTNLELCMRLIAAGRLNVDSITTHTIRLENVEEEIAAIIEAPDNILSVVFEMRRET